MKPFVSCCTRTPALRHRTRPSPVIAAKCWMQARRRIRAVPKRQRRHHRQPPKGNWQRVRRSAIQGHADRASPIQRIFSAAAESDSKANPPILKSKSLWVQRPRPTRVHSRVTRARRGRWTDRENAVALASVCHWQRCSGVRLHSCCSADRLPLPAANARPKQVQKQNGARYRTKNRWARAK